MTKEQQTPVCLTIPPSLSQFKGLSGIEQRTAYMHAFKSLVEGKSLDPENLKKQLQKYVEAAGWDEKDVRFMQASVQTPIH